MRELRDNATSFAVAITLAALAGAANGFALPTGDLGVLVLCLVPVLFAAALIEPQAALAVYLFAGAFTVGTNVQVDVGVLLGFVLWAVVLVRLLDGERLAPPWPFWLLIPLVLVVLAGVIYSAEPAYGLAKGVRFATLGMMAVIGPATLVRTDEERRRFRLVLTLVAGFFAVTGVILGAGLGRLTTDGRWTSFGGGPITLARASAVAVIGCIVAVVWEPRWRWIAILVVPLAGWALLGAASRGPLLAAVIGVGAALLLGLFRRGLRPSVILIAALGGAAAVYAAIRILPTTSLGTRLQLTGSGLDGSLMGRVDIANLSTQLWRSYPVTGVGTGSFSNYHYLDYPHNLFLELAAENGSAAAALMILFVVVAVLAGIRWAWRSWGPESLFTVALVTVSALNAVVSGDLNDNQMLLAFAALALTGAHDVPTASKEATP